MNFKKFFYTTLLLTSVYVTVNNCSSETEILATYDGGTVTRGELNFVLEASKRGNAEPQTINPDVQVRIIESVALEKILMQDSIQSKKVDPQDIQKIEALVADFLKMNIYLRDYVKMTVEKKPLEFINLQIAILRDENGEANEKKAEELLAQLENASSSEIDNIISNVTDDQGNKPIAGRMEPFCTNCMATPMEDIIEAATSVKKGKFVKFSKDPRMIYVLRSLGAEKVHSSRVAKYYTKAFTVFQNQALEYGKTHTDEESKSAISYHTEGNPEEKGKQYAAQMLKQFEQGAFSKEIERIKTESGITMNPNLPKVFGPEQINPKDFPADLVLYTNKDKTNYTWKDLETDFSSVPVSLKSDYKDDKAKIFDMINLFNSTLLQGKIAKTSEVIQKVGTNTAYKMQMDKMKAALALKALQDEIKAEPITITEQQMKDTYEAGKLYAYSIPDSKNPSNRIPQSYPQVRERIKTELEGAARNSFIEKKVSALKSTYNLKIDQNRLKEVIL